MSLEDQFWNGLREIARSEQTTVTALVEKIDMDRNSNLSSAIRLFVLDYFRARRLRLGKPRRTSEAEEGATGQGRRTVAL